MYSYNFLVKNESIHCSIINFFQLVNTIINQLSNKQTAERVWLLTYRHTQGALESNRILDAKTQSVKPLKINSTKGLRHDPPILRCKMGIVHAMKPCLDIAFQWNSGDWFVCGLSLHKSYVQYLYIQTEIYIGIAPVHLLCSWPQKPGINPNKCTL